MSDSGQLSPLKRAFLALETAQAKLDALERAARVPIAVIGVGCRFPGGADTPEKFWQLLIDGRDAVVEVPSDRWDVDALYDAEPGTPGKVYTRWGGYLDRIDQFDAPLFGIAPREAAGMDPQQRLLLEVSWEAFEHAGLAPDRLSGTPTGVFVGLCTSDYANLQIKGTGLEAIDAYRASGNAHSVAAGRLSYVLGLQGPSIAIDTACSSSLVAVHLACQSLRTTECSMAIAGGVHLSMSPENTISFCKSRMLAADRRCKTFDAAADGFVEGEGCGMVVLKRLPDALRDGDRVLALIRGSAINQDGPSSGLTAPNGPSQEAVIRSALAMAGLSPGLVSYVEAHGTGTSLGDPMELQALGNVFREGRAPDRPLLVGSVKTNMGHLEAAAGVAGLIKAVLSLQHDTIPPQLHFEVPTPHVPWAELPLSVVTAPTAWPTGPPSRTAGVSAFGFSGTNAHIVLEEAPASVHAEDRRPLHLLTISARTDDALRESARRWAAAVENSTDALGDICFTANTGRAQLAERAAIVVRNTEEAAGRLRALAEGQTPRELFRGRAPADAPRIAFLFTGQGSQYVGMGRELYETEPAFRKTIDYCDQILTTITGRSIRALMHGSAEDEAALGQTQIAQPALFALEYALAHLWRSWGIEPYALIGHSLGEYVAACVAGVFSLEDGLAIVAARGRLMQTLCQSGAMAAVMTDEATAQAAIAGEPRLSMAAINAPDSIVLSGDGAALGRVLGRLSSAGVAAERLDVSHAFHSPLIEPMLDDFERTLAGVHLSPPTMRIVSNLTAQVARGELATKEYWRRHVRETVRFKDGVHALHVLGCSLFVEIGPRPVLSGLGRRCLGGEGVAWLPSLRPGRSDWQQMLETAARLSTAGLNLDWRATDRRYGCTPVTLPTYPFERQRYWFDASSGPGRRREPEHRIVHPLLGGRIQSASQDLQFSVRMDPAYLPFLRDHGKLGTLVFPATGLLEMGSAVADIVFGAGMHDVLDLVVSDPLVIDPEDPPLVQTIVSLQGDHGAEMRVFSWSGGADENGEWRLHATATVRRGSGAGAPRQSLGELRSRVMERVDVPDYYERMRRDGHDYGPSFRGITELYRGEREALARVELPETASAAPSGFVLHPAVVDAAMQAIGAALTPAEIDEGSTYIPLSLDRFSMRRAGPASVTVWSAVRLRPSSQLTAAAFIADVEILDQQGDRLALVEGVCFRKANKERLQRSAPDIAGLLYEVHWKETPLDVTAGPEVSAGAWVVLGTNGTLTKDIAARLESAGGTPFVITPADGFAADPTSRRFEVNPGAADDVAQVFAAIAATGTIQGVIHLWNAEAVSAEHSLVDAQMLGTASVLHSLQGLVAATGATARTWVVTRGAVPADGNVGAEGLWQSAALGLARTLRAEHPETRCTIVDLDRSSDAGALWAAMAASAEAEIAVRHGRFLVPRLGRVKAAARSAAGAGEPVELAIGTPGVLDGLQFKPLTRRTPSEEEVEVEVLATGLNFRDVLNALGTYQGPPGPLGSECVGRIVAVGQRVVGFEPGHEVLVTWPGTFKSYVTVPAEFVFPKPPCLSVEEAATIPVAFLTADYALNHLGRLGAGDRVLIHAAAGGVGLAAVQLAQRIGAEIFATAGSPAKRAYLASLGVTHVFDSRSLQFAADVMEATGGEGVDLVLNSLAGDFIERSLGVMRPGGRFLELGKSGIWSAERVAQSYPDVEYHTIYLGKDEAPVTRVRFAALLDAFARGELKPLPRRDFSLGEAVGAYRFMAQARHIGKVVLVHRHQHPQGSGSGRLDERSTYVVSGAFGGLGLEVAQHLVDRGARFLALIGRRAPSAAAADRVRQWETAGARVLTLTGDVAVQADVRQMFTAIDDALPSVRGVIHLAAVVDDGPLAEQTWARFRSVLEPKALGAWNLHEATAGRPLDFFVLFSSMVSIFGASGQGNYTAANAFLDALAHYRRTSGLTAVSINWGPWADVGLAARLDPRVRRGWARQGLSEISPVQGVEALDRVLAEGASQIAVLPINWSVAGSQWRVGEEPRLLTELVRRHPVDRAQPASLREEIASVMPSERPALVERRIVLEAIKILGLDENSAIDPQQPLSELGLDSLMAVELRNGLGALVRQSLPATLLFRCPTIDTLTVFLCHDILQIGAADRKEEASRTSQEHEAIAALDDDEAKRLLANELASLSSAGLLDGE